MVWDYPWGTRGIYTRTNPFNVFINDLLLFIKETDICNFADDATLYPCGKELDTISLKIKIETNTAIQSFKDNEMVANPSKFRIMVLPKYKNIEKTCLLMEKPLNHQIQLNCLDFPRQKY